LPVRTSAKGHDAPRAMTGDRRGAQARPAGPGLGARFADGVDGVECSSTTRHQGRAVTRRPRTGEIQKTSAPNHARHLELTKLVRRRSHDAGCPVSSMMQHVRLHQPSRTSTEARRYSAWVAYDSPSFGQPAFTRNAAPPRRGGVAGEGTRRPPGLLRRPTCRCTGHSGAESRRVESIGNKAGQPDADLGDRQTV